MADDTSPTTRVQEITFVQVIDNPRPCVDWLTPLPLTSEPATDKGFVTPNGTRIRARVVRQTETEAVAPTNGAAKLAPSSLTLSLSLAAIDDDDAVMTDADGRLLIMDRHELVLSDEAMRVGLIDIPAFVERAIRAEAWALEQRITKRTELADYLASEWGGAISPVAPEPEPYIPPLPPLDADAS